MRLWTYQPPIVAEALSDHERHDARWDRIDDAWKPAYHWMVAQMVTQGVLTEGRPPIWAWHSCGGWSRRPTAETGESLLSEAELERGVVLLELEVPVRSAVLSWYSGWNVLLDEMLDGTSPEECRTTGLFDVDEDAYSRFEDPEDEDVQACLPYVDPAWLRSVDPVAR